MKSIIAFILLGLLAVCERPPSPNMDHSAHDHSNANVNEKAMDHSRMGSSPGAANAPQELQFIDTMIAHHEGAIEMALLVNNRSRRPEMQELAKGILEAQRGEVDKMREWRMKWFGDAKPAVNLDLPGMHTGMSGMDLKKLELLKANEFDVEFLKQMIPHHEGAIEMAKALSPADKYLELIELRGAIIRTQTAEIAKMKAWLMVWSVSK